MHAWRYGQQVGGTHPTGMQSCFFLFSYFPSQTIFWIYIWLLSFCGTTDAPVLTSALSFKAIVDSCLRALHTMKSSGVTPADLLAASMVIKPF